MNIKQNEDSSLLNKISNLVDVSISLEHDLYSLNNCSKLISSVKELDNSSIKLLRTKVESIYKRYRINESNKHYSTEEFDALVAIDDAFGKVLNTADNISNRYANAKKDVSKALDNAKDKVLEKLSDIWDKSKELFKKYFNKKTEQAKDIKTSSIEVQETIEDKEEYLSNNKVVINLTNDENVGNSISEKEFVKKISDLLNSVIEDVNIWLNDIANETNVRELDSIKLDSSIDKTLEDIEAVYSTSKDALSKSINDVTLIVNKAVETIEGCGNKTLTNIKKLESNIDNNSNENVPDITKMIKEGIYEICKKLSKIIDVCNDFIKKTNSSIKSGYNEWMEDCKENKK